MTEIKKEPRKPVTIGPINSKVPPPDATGFETVRTLVGTMKNGENVFVENCTEGVRSMFYKAAHSHGAFMAAMRETIPASAATERPWAPISVSLRARRPTRRAE